MSEFSEWLQGKYLDWRGNEITGRNVSAFARYIGVSQPVMSNWLAGNQEPGSVDNVMALVRIYGREALSIMELESAIVESIVAEYGDQFRELAGIMTSVPPEQQDEVVEKFRGLLQQLGFKVS